MYCHLNIKCHYQFQSSHNTHTHATHAHVLEPGSQLMTLIVWKAVEPLGCGVAQRKWVTGRQVLWATGRSHLCPGLWFSDPQDVSRLGYHRPACLPTGWTASSGLQAKSASPPLSCMASCHSNKKSNEHTP